MNTQLIDSLARIILSLSEEERELLNRKIESECLLLNAIGSQKRDKFTIKLDGDSRLYSQG